MKENNQIKDKKLVLFFILCGITCILTLSYWFISDRKAYREILNTDFAGKVKKIEYDIKELPTITVGDSTYYISYATNHQIEIGDSIIKKRDSDFYILIKHETHKIIKLTN